MAQHSRRPWEREDTGENSLYLKQILKLHSLGWPSVKIGKKFGKDHTTILYHLRKLGVPRGLGRGYRRPATVNEIEISLIYIEPQTPPKKTYKYDYLFDEPVNPGKSYAEYMKDAGKSKEHIQRVLAEKRKAVSLDGHSSIDLPPKGW